MIYSAIIILMRIGFEYHLIMKFYNWLSPFDPKGATRAICVA